MQLDTLALDNSKWIPIKENIKHKDKAELVLMFGDTDLIKQSEHYSNIKNIYPCAHIVGCSSSGNILGVEVTQSPLIATAISFDQARVELSYVDVQEGDDIEQKTAQLVAGLNENDLKHIIVISDGLKINGSELARGLNNTTTVPVSGGLAGDGMRFQETYIIADSPPEQQRVVALGLYGASLSIGTGCYAGWSAFGAQRTITKSHENVVYEIDGEPALDLYKRYLGEYSEELPYSGFRFPLSIKKHQDAPEVIRTLIGVDEAENSITFAGNVPTGYTARLMKPNIDVLIEGAGKAAEKISRVNTLPAFAIVVSCAGRRFVMGQEIEEELDAVRNILGESVQLTGFYSYGEIAPFSEEIISCELHNQTMTLTVIYES